MNQFTVEETNLVSIYHAEARGVVTERMTAALPYMDSEMQELARRTVDKLNAMTDDEFSRLSIDAAEDDG